MIRSVHASLAFLAAVVVVSSGSGMQAASAAPKPAPSAAPSAAPSPTAAPESLDKAIPRLEAKIKADPNDKAATTELAQDYYSANRPDLALALTQKLIAGGTKTAQIYYLDGIANNAVGREKEAIADLENASNLEPTNTAVLGALTNLYLHANRASDAERVAKRALTFNKDDKDAHINYGMVLATEQKYDDARQQFDAAAKLDPKDAHPVVLQAKTYADQNAIALAAQVFDRAVQIDPTSAEALSGKARVAAAQHNVKEAVSTLETLLKVETNDADKAAVVDEIARVYAVEKMDTEADASYRRAIADYPKVPSAHVAYGDYLAFKKDTAGAEREWTTAAGPNRDNPEALARLAEYYAGKNDIGKVIDNYKRITEVANGDPRSFLALGQAYAANKQFDKARDAFKQSYGRGHSAEALVGLAQSDYETRNYSECAQIYESLDKAAPDLTKRNPQILYVLGQCYQKSNQSSKARAAYVRFLAYTKPGSQANTQVKQLIDQLDHGAKAAPKK